MKNETYAIKTLDSELTGLFFVIEWSKHPQLYDAFVYHNWNLHKYPEKHTEMEIDEKIYKVSDYLIKCINRSEYGIYFTSDLEAVISRFKEIIPREYCDWRHRKRTFY